MKYKKKEVWRDFREKTFAELDAEVEEALKAERNAKIRLVLIVLLILFMLVPNAFLYWFRFCFPYAPSERTDEVIDIRQDPVQSNLTDDEKRIIKYTPLEYNDVTYNLVPMAKYSVSGMVIAKNYYFWGNYLPGGRRVFQDVSLIDIGLAWNDFADKDVLKYYRTVSVKNAVARTLFLVYKNKRGVVPYSWDEIRGQHSHTHVIPKSRAVMHALLFTNRYQSIKMEGYLVDFSAKGQRFVTSLSRYDTNQTSRGGGACEIMYVERVQIGDKIYE